MGKTLFLGNENTKKWAATISNSQFLQMPIFSLGEDGERKLCEYVVNNVDCDSKAIVIDVDEISNPELCLALAMTVRLSIMDIKSAALVAILFASRTTQDILMGYKYSSIILTDCVIIDCHENIKDALDVIKPLSPNDYKERFLNFVKIIPNATEGRHSLANQWGADVLSRVVIGSETKNELIKKARQSLYFKYTRVVSFGSKDIDNLINNTEPHIDVTHIDPINASGKKILLIDDEADKGWKDVLSELLKGAEVKSIQEQVPDYESLSQDAKSEIESGKYDLIFLDLRMNGVLEENSFNPHDFSGMKILKEIKHQNKGNKVIIFTASNKAWNMKAILDAGADGYYIKESPEFAYQPSYSYNNAAELCDNINLCFENGYLRKVYTKIKHIKQLIEESNCFGERTDEILGSVDIAFDLLSKSNINGDYKVYAYLQLFKVIEEYANSSTLFDSTEYDWFLYNGETRYRLLIDGINEGKNTKYKSIISMDGTGHFSLKKGTYTCRYLETNYRVSALLIFKFSESTSAAHQWTKINTIRHECAHPNRVQVTQQDFHRILGFMQVFFDESKANWRELSDAFPDATYEDRLALLQEKFSKK